MPRRCAVLGDPVEHSLSPVLHRAGHAAAGLTDWVYDAVRVPSGGLPAYVDGLEGSGEDWRGLSLTMPLKRELVALAAERGWGVGERVRTSGVANTLLRVEGSWRTDNTDWPGAAAAVRERWGKPVGSAVLVGAGATAASVGLALADLGATRLVVAARSAARAAETVEVLRRHPAGPVVEVVDLHAGGSADALVSTVPAEAQPDLVGTWAAPLVFEALYDPWPTPWARWSQDEGATLVGGLDLLVHQAALQLTAMTGAAADVEAMRAAGLAALAARA